MSYTYEAPYRLAPYAGSLKRKNHILFPSQSLKGLNYSLILYTFFITLVNRRKKRQRTFSDRADRFSLTAVIFFGFIADRALYPSHRPFDLSERMVFRARNGLVVIKTEL